MASSCFISTIPLEVLLRITDSLKTPDLCSFRLTCRSVEQSLYNTFVTEFFARKQFMVSNFSLQALIDMAKSRLGQHMRVVQIATDHFNEANDVSGDEPEQKKRYQELVAEETSLWATSQYVDMLTEAFVSLPNLQDVIIRDCNSKSRSRDGWRHEWTSYGAPTVLEETRVKLGQRESIDWARPNFPLDIPSQVFIAVLHALAASDAPLRGIEVIARNGWRLGNEAFTLPAETEGETGIGPVLARLEKLHLCIESPPPMRPVVSDGESSPPEAAHERLLAFLAKTSGVKNLRINEAFSKDGTLGRLIERMAQTPGSDPSEETFGETSGEKACLSPALVVLMPHLEELSLGLIDIEAPILLSLIAKFAPSLRTLELWKVHLERDLPADADIGPNLPEISFWPSFFKKLLAIPNLELHHIKAGMLQQQWRGRRERPRVAFGGSRATVAYTGTDWRNFVEKEVLGKLEVLWPPKVEPSVDMEGEESSDDPEPDPFGMVLDDEHFELLLTGALD